MGNSYKNTSSGGSGKDASGNHFLPIGENKAKVPPAGASNSYEGVRKKIDAKDNSALSKNRYTKEKMMNK